jgi:hypothetical protein
VQLSAIRWWREANPGSSTVEGRVRKEGQMRGRKKKAFGGWYDSVPAFVDGEEVEDGEDGEDVEDAEDVEEKDDEEEF